MGLQHMLQSYSLGACCGAVAEHVAEPVEFDLVRAIGNKHAGSLEGSNSDVWSMESEFSH